MEYLRDALSGMPTTNGQTVSVYRTRLDALPAAQLPAFNLEIERETESKELEDTVTAVGRDLVVNVYCVVGATDDEETVSNPPKSIDQIADPLTTWVEQKVLADITMGGYAELAWWNSAAWTNKPEDIDLTGVRLTFTISYYTQRGDPTQR